MSHPNMHVPKIAVDVELLLADGRALPGQVYILANQRVLDMLNGPEPFFAFRRMPSGEVELLNKAAVASVRPLDQRG